MSMSAATPFDFTPLLPAGLPAPAARWTGLAKYSFVGGNNDPEQVPVEQLCDDLAEHAWQGHEIFLCAEKHLSCTQHRIIGTS